MPSISKILEKVVAYQLDSFLDRILPEKQSGFRRCFSTTSALLNTVDQLLINRDKNLNSVMAALDFSEAFDSVNFDLFLAKLKYYRFHESAIEWFRSYLYGRTQLTKIDEKYSESMTKVRGVPQGSCLGPIIFILYIADLEKELSFCSLYSYADDSQLLFSYSPSRTRDTVRMVNADLWKLHAWSQSHGLKLNSSKCSVVHFDGSFRRDEHSRDDFALFLGGETMNFVESVKVLGLTIDSRLKFSAHLTHIIRRVWFVLRTLNRLRNLLPEAAKLHIVKTIVFPILEYSLPVFGYVLTLESIVILTRLQNAALRFVYSLRKYDHISQYRKKAGILPIKEICDIRSLVMVHGVLYSGRPSYLKDKLIKRSDMRERPTRQDVMLQLPRVRLESTRGGFSYFGPQKYNGPAF